MKRYPDWIFPVILAAIVLSLYGRTVGYGFIKFDDYINGTPWVRSGLSLEGIRHVFLNPVKNIYMPLVLLSFMLEVEIFGLWAGGFHLINTMFHMANVMLLFFVFRKLSARKGPSFIAAVLFAVHPLHVESVAWIAERKDVMSAFFILLTLLAYEGWVNRSSRRAYWVGVLCFLAALFSKPMSVSLPICLLLLDYWPLNRMRESGESGKIRLRRLGELIWEKWPFFFLAGCFSLISLWATPSDLFKIDLNVLPLGARFQNALLSYAIYLKKLLVPLNLAVLYPHPGVGMPLWFWLISALVLALLSAAAVFWRKKVPWFLTGWLWFLVTLLPVIGLVQVGSQAMADRFVYFPSWGLYWALSWSVMVWMDHGWISKKVFGLSMAVLISVFFVLTWIQIGYWRNTITLFRHAAQVTRNNWRMENELASNLMWHGKLNEAERHLALAWKAGPDQALTNLNLGRLYLEKGDLFRAEYHSKKVMAVCSNFPQSHFLLGGLLAKRGKWAAAAKELEISLEQDGPSSNLFVILGQVYSKQGKEKLAAESFREALKLDPGNLVAEKNLNKIEMEKKHE